MSYAESSKSSWKKYEQKLSINSLRPGDAYMRQ